MPTKLKFFLGVLVVVAGVAVYSFAGAINSLAKSSIASIGSLTSQNQNGIVSINDDDTDHDGLADIDETDYDTDPFKADTDGDGYLDGEEVLAGSDPVEADHDIEKQTLTASNNLTTSYVQTLVEGYLAGDLTEFTDPDGAKSLNVLASTVLSGVTERNAVAPSTALTVIDSSPEDVTAYLTRVRDILNLIPPQDKYLSNEKSDAKTFRTLEIIFGKVRAKMDILSVPQEFADWHKRTTITLAKSQVFYRSMANMETDPVLALAELELFPDIYADLLGEANELNIILEKNKFDVGVYLYTATPEP